MGAHTFDAEIQEGRGGGAFVRIPFDVEVAFGTRGRVPVRATFDGQPYRGSIAPMGGGHLLGITKAIRGAIGKDVGDAVRVVLERDTGERTVEVPAELAEALAASPGATAAFDALSYTHRREHAQHVAEAKREETRRRRAGKTVERLLGGAEPS